MNTDKLLLDILTCCFFLGLVACQSSVEETDTIKIEGNLVNLPDGLVTLFNDKQEPIVSSRSRKGKFVLQVSRRQYPEPIYVQLQHVEDSSKIKRFVQLKTIHKHRQELYFMLENDVVIGDSLEDFIPIDVKFLDGRKLVTVNKKITTGKQTQALLNDSLGIYTTMSFEQLKHQIIRYPYSYHYLHQLERQVSNFNNSQFSTLLGCFDKDVRESKTGRELSEYVENRKTKKLDFTTTLVDREGQKQFILDKNASLNIVILWASWCGPCRKEIPQLKKIRESFALNSKLSMVSISVDDNKEDWYKALDKEQMPWRQLLITPEANTYSKELFNFDGSIPTTLFVDNQGKIIKKFVGYNEKGLEELKKLIVEHNSHKVL